jgi:hypothetical protein
MSHFVNTVEEDKCVFLTYEGDMPLVEMVTARYEANELLAARRWNRIVVNITGLQSKLTALELFELARVLSSDLPHNARVALVVRSEQTRHAKFAESVARNDGMALKFFFDVEKAAAWAKGTTLREGPGTSGSAGTREPNEFMTTTVNDLTLEICADDGSRTQFYQSDEDGINKILHLLITPRLFTQPLLTLASEHSVSAIPCRTIDLILARTPNPPPLPLPPGWLNIVEVSAEALYDGADKEGSGAATDEALSLVEIHTLGNWMIRLKLQTAIQATIQEQRQFCGRFFDLPVIPFRLEAGGIGLINPPKISRVTVHPPFKGVAETALPADLLRCIRS